MNNPDPHNNDRSEPDGPGNEASAENVQQENPTAHRESNNLDPLQSYSEADALHPSAEETSGADQKIVALQAELDQAKDQMLRALAEAENARKRAQKDREDAIKFSTSSFARDLLSVADNIRRAIEAVPGDLVETEPRLKNLVEGIEATERDLLNAFERNKIKKIDPTGEIFDPNYHEVMFETPGTGQPPGTIIQVMETGYLLHNRLLRPARVGVAKDEGQGNGGAGNEAPSLSPGGNLDTEA